MEAEREGGSCLGGAGVTSGVLVRQMLVTGQERRLALSFPAVLCSEDVCGAEGPEGQSPQSPQWMTGNSSVTGQ